jgi:hypothetical protein
MQGFAWMPWKLRACAAQKEISGREVSASQHDSGGLIQSGDDGLRAVALCIPPAATRELI